MRFLLALIALIVGVVGGLLVYHQVTAGPPVVLPAPVSMKVTGGGTPLLPGGWTTSHAITLSVQARPHVVAGLDVELRPQDQGFSGTVLASTATAASAHCSGSQTCTKNSDGLVATMKLPDGSYHWQGRLHNASGVSPWKPYPGLIRVDTAPPTLPTVISPTDPDPHTVYHSSTLLFNFQASDTGSGVVGYSYRTDKDPNSQAPQEMRTTKGTVKLVGMDTGLWFFHVRAVDRAGNWGPSATFLARIDVTPPGLQNVHFSSYQLDPLFESLHVSFAVTRPATRVRVGIYNQDTKSRVRLYTFEKPAVGQALSFWWNGKDNAGRAVATGTYEIFIRTFDQYGHSGISGWKDFAVSYKRIVVSLSQQKLTAYDGNKVFLTSLVTTGNKALPTPTGTFHIFARFSPFTFRSMWPPSSPYYYPPSEVQYAMMFQSGGYFIHDAPWRSVFGPGSNSQVGTPGQNYTGTHGCVNVPSDVALKLWNWAPIGTLVQVVN